MRERDRERAREREDREKREREKVSTPTPIDGGSILSAHFSTTVLETQMRVGNQMRKRESEEGERQREKRTKTRGTERRARARGRDSLVSFNHAQSAAGGNSSVILRRVRRSFVCPIHDPHQIQSDPPHPDGTR